MKCEKGSFLITCPVCANTLIITNDDTKDSPTDIKRNNMTLFVTCFETIEIVCECGNIID